MQFYLGKESARSGDEGVHDGEGLEPELRVRRRDEVQEAAAVRRLGRLGEDDVPQREGVEPRQTVDGGVDGVQRAGLQRRDRVPAQVGEVHRHRDHAQLSGVGR